MLLLLFLLRVLLPSMSRDTWSGSVALEEDRSAICGELDDEEEAEELELEGANEEEDEGKAVD